MARLQEGAVGSKSALDYLREAQMILSTRERWTKGAIARNGAGAICMADDKAAACYSLEGALVSIQPHNSSEWLKAMRLLRQVAGTDNLAQWNHRWWRTHRSVLRVLDLAMARAI